MDIIKRHLIVSILDKIELYLESYDTNFIYFNKPVFDPKFGKIDRMNKWAPFREDEITPVGYSLLSGSTLLKMWMNIKKSKIHYYYFKGSDYIKVKIK